MKTPEQEAVIRLIRKLLDFWKIVPDELEFEREFVPQPVIKAPLGPKYRHPVSHETWDGHGAQPPWLRQALTRQGYTVEELRVLAGPDQS